MLTLDNAVYIEIRYNGVQTDPGRISYMMDRTIWTVKSNEDVTAYINELRHRVTIDCLEENEELRLFQIVTHFERPYWQVDNLHNWHETASKGIYK